MKATSIINSQCLLGEGPVWHESRLWWVDIDQKQLLSWNPQTGSSKEFILPEKVGFAVPTSGPQWAVGLQSGIFLWDPDTRTIEEVYSPEKDCSASRFNDGKCDPQGRLWAGTVKMTPSGGAALYRMEKGCDGRKMLSGITISNGLAWDMSRGKMYYIDSMTSRVEAFEFDPHNGGISSRRTILSIPEEGVVPDGMTIDSEGMLWIALWGGFGVIRVDPTDGTILSKIDVPAARVTSCAFGSDRMDTLYITTARVGMNDEELARFPESGNIFAVKPGVSGLPVTPFKL